MQWSEKVKTLGMMNFPETDLWSESYSMLRDKTNCENQGAFSMNYCHWIFTSAETSHDIGRILFRFDHGFTAKLLSTVVCWTKSLWISLTTQEIVLGI